MNNYIQPGKTLDLAPGANVDSGEGHLFGTSLFGVAAEDVLSGEVGPFVTEGVVEIAKTSALAITTGTRVYWNVANKVVNTTSTSQQCVGIAVSDAPNPSPTVRIKLGSYTAVGA